MYISERAEKNSGKVNLLASQHDRGETKPNPMESETAVHFIYSQLVGENQQVQTLNTVVFSFDLAKQIHLSTYRLNKHLAFIDPDVSDRVHEAYIRGALSINEVEAVDASWGHESDTVFIGGLPFEGWMMAEIMLCKLRQKRIINRATQPRLNKGQKFEDDIVDEGLGRIILRVNEILNHLLKFGQVEDLPCFSPDTELI